MSPSAQRERPLLVCALEFERRMLLRAGLGGTAEIHCCGPGVNNVRSWAGQVHPANRVVILCGVAGGLSPKLAPGDAMVMVDVIDPVRNVRRRSEVVQECSRQSQFPLGSIAGSSTIIHNPQAKRELFERTGAQMVDMESAAFAEIAADRGWRWAIVRGVSDGADESLPIEAANWVDERGRTKPLAVAGTLLRRPVLVPTMLRLRRNSALALDSVADLVRKLINCETTRSRAAN